MNDDEIKLEIEDEPLCLEEYRANREISEGDIEQILEIAHRTDSIEIPAELMQESGPSTEAETSDVRAKLSRLSVPQKIKAAMFGNEVVRNILVMDHNRIIQDFVIRNPRLMLPEVENFTKNTNISDHVLRLVSNSKAWMRYYSVKFNLVCNPKTPQDVALKWLRHMRESDLKKLSKSKGIPQLIATTAQKMVTTMQEKH